ncbi:hypothetical protein BT63DRAFT_459635 [Microthyrium microscopicum]|uniref:BTB domain-containing protein n=1 Tax=Microthyrium microscopicum TaxID=703497 RepID=A0A6A6U240_9PEZI|nr:hypothetical protein BT63DRAFT_459635 [Microthyrium microscopicum]
MAQQPVTPVYYRDFGYPNSKRWRLDMDGKSVLDVTAKQYAELLSGPTVDVYVGQEQRHWKLHRNLLIYHSEYFQHELQAQSTSSTSALVSALSMGDSDDNAKFRLNLPDEDPAGFELLVRWFYQGKLDDVSNIPDSQDKYAYVDACQRLHILCHKFQMPHLMNQAIDQYRKGLNEAGLVPDSSELADIYTRSPVGSPFRTLMTRIAARQILHPESDKNAESYRKCFAISPDFGIELVDAIKRGTGGVTIEDPTEGDAHEFHSHDTGHHPHINGSEPEQNKPNGVETSSRLSSPPKELEANSPVQITKLQNRPKKRALYGTHKEDAVKELSSTDPFVLPMSKQRSAKAPSVNGSAVKK